MNKMRNGSSVLIWFVAIVLLSVFGCTSNPFGGDDISASNRQVKGRVELNSGASSKDVYVWLDGLEVGTRVDENGEFQLFLPPPEAQGSAGGVSGVFDLHFYMANFGLVTAEMVTRNGTFVYPHGDFNEEGELAHPKRLTQILRVTTELSPCSLEVGEGGLVGARFTLEAKTDSVTVYFPKQTDEVLGPVLIRNVETGEISIYESVIPEVQSEDITVIARDPLSRLVIISMIGNPLPAGVYEVIPFVHVRHDPVPAALFESLGTEVIELSPDYLKIPFYREGTRLTIY